MNLYGITDEFGYDEDYSYLEDLIDLAIKKLVNILQTISLCKNFGKCLLIADRPINNKNPQTPPTQ